MDILPEQKIGTSSTSSDEHLPNNSYGKDLILLHFDNETRVYERQQVKVQQS